jgi:bifunctional UDP-N-acetylglucosamine pyrophosphorylase/glucosamine-1-phosphate N-acetyltransferase
MDTELVIIVLAAGQGTRMRSDLPKVLHPVGGRPLLGHVLEVAQGLSPESIHVVYGHGGEALRSHFESQPGLNWCHQSPQLGTGHAVQQALPHIDPEATVLVLYGDVPLIRAKTLSALLERLAGHGLSLLSVELADPSGYGRVLREPMGAVRRIVEHRDAQGPERAIAEVNTGILAARAGDLQRWLDGLDNANAQGEYYLTDCVAAAVQEGLVVSAMVCPDPQEVMGVNDKAQLAACERAYQRRQAERLMHSGVTLLDPGRIDVRGEVSVGRDVTLDIDVILEGEVSLGDGVHIGAHCIIRDTHISAGTELLPFTVIECSEVGERCQIGPYTRIRPDTRLADEVHLGNFVEVKKSFIDARSKVNHLSYIGDSLVGKRVNVGAGTITCNYDGGHKHTTHIGDDVFIGSDTQLIAPVSVGDGATIGAGTTITRDAPAGQLTVGRARQVSVAGWQRPRKDRK